MPRASASTPAAAAAAPAAAEPAASPAAPATGSPEADAAAIALFDEAMASGAAETGTDGEPPGGGGVTIEAEPPAPVEGVEPGEEDQGEEGAEGEPPQGEEPPPEGEPAKPAVEAAAPAKPARDKPEDAAAKAAIEKEIADRGLKGDTATRFRELSHQVRELSQIRDVEVPRLKEVERLHTQWQSIVADSTATAPQLNQALGYIQSVNSGDPAKLAIAAKAMLEEVKWAFGKLGWELPGVVDPLAAHADLAEAVETGAMTKAGALEVAQARALTAVNAARDEQSNTQREVAAAEGEAMKQIDLLSARLKRADPLFAAKLPYLKPAVDTIRETLHPSRWPAEIERAYRAIPNPTPAPAPAPRRPGPSPMPLRPTGGSQAAAATVRKFTKEQVDAGDPFDMGVKEAQARGL